MSFKKLYRTWIILFNSLYVSENNVCSHCSCYMELKCKWKLGQVELFCLMSLYAYFYTRIFCVLVQLLRRGFRSLIVVMDFSVFAIFSIWSVLFGRSLIRCKSVLDIFLTDIFFYIFLTNRFLYSGHISCFEIYFAWY